MLITDSFAGATGGSEKHIKDLIEGLPKNNYQISVVQLSNTAKIPFPSGTICDNTRYYHFPVKRVYGLSGLKAFKKLKQIIHNDKIDITLSFHEMSDIINALLPSVSIKLSSRRDMGFKRNKLLESMILYANKSYTRVLCPSIAVQNKVLSEGVAKEKTHLLYNGIDSGQFKTIQEYNLESRHELLSELGITPTDVNIICIGNLHEWKGHKYLIDAMAQIPKVSYNLVIFGEGTSRGDLEKQINSLQLNDSIHLPGYCTNIKRYLCAFDLMILPSLTEGLSNALLESAVSGIPLIATNVGGNPEVIENNHNGRLVEAENATQIAQAITEFLPDSKKYQQASIASRQIAEDKFSLVAMLNNYQELFHSLIESK